MSKPRRKATGNCNTPGASKVNVGFLHIEWPQDDPHVKGRQRLRADMRQSR
ncbi:uncharacterized protein TrAtP1_007510 [Trichoderma atroviride]|uniref:uncharacterized protein n=1 Tax=Hypocrea atroviridis TaxID=63577 RepID=UPI00331ADA7F|nr:hypothetical protein TrAtP1_007510 [Trichoderma atroviride]